jgi:hypothetical protein
VQFVHNYIAAYNKFACVIQLRLQFAWELSLLCNIMEKCSLKMCIFYSDMSSKLRGGGVLLFEGNFECVLSLTELLTYMYVVVPRRLFFAAQQRIAVT